MYSISFLFWLFVIKHGYLQIHLVIQVSHNERLGYGMFRCIQLRVHSDNSYPHIVHRTDVVNLGVHSEFISFWAFVCNSCLCAQSLDPAAWGFSSSRAANTL